VVSASALPERESSGEGCFGTGDEVGVVVGSHAGSAGDVAPRGGDGSVGLVIGFRHGRGRRGLRRIQDDCDGVSELSGSVSCGKGFIGMGYGVICGGE